MRKVESRISRVDSASLDMGSARLRGVCFGGHKEGRPFDNHNAVTPAQAGGLYSRGRCLWSPAFAGVTTEVRSSKFCRHSGSSISAGHGVHRSFSRLPAQPPFHCTFLPGPIKDRPQPAKTGASEMGGPSMAASPGA